MNKYNIAALEPFSLVDCETKEILQAKCISRELKRALDQYGMSLSEDFNKLRKWVLMLYVTAQCFQQSNVANILGNILKGSNTACWLWFFGF